MRRPDKVEGARAKLCQPDHPSPARLEGPPVALDALFEEVLLACALTNKDSLGKFATADVRVPLRLILGREVPIGGYQSHLAKFCEPERGPVLKKSGKRRSYRWQFVNPQIIPYILIRGKERGVSL